MILLWSSQPRFKSYFTFRFGDVKNSVGTNVPQQLYFRIFEKKSNQILYATLLLLDCSVADDVTELLVMKALESHCHNASFGSKLFSLLHRTLSLEQLRISKKVLLIFLVHFLISDNYFKKSIKICMKILTYIKIREVFKKPMGKWNWKMTYVLLVPLDDLWCISSGGCGLCVSMQDRKKLASFSSF